MFPDTLLRAVRKGYCVPFVGAGISREVRLAGHSESLFPTWVDLLHGLAEVARKRGDRLRSVALDHALLAVPLDLTLAAERAFEALGADIWTQHLRDVFDIPQECVDPTSLELPRAVWGLGANRIVTTNYENVLSWARPNALVCTSRQRTEVGEFIRAEDHRPRVWHLHGHIAQMDSLIVTRKNYQELYTIGEDRGHLAFEPGRIGLPILMARDRLLILGYGLGDPEIVADIRNLAEIFGLGAGRHFTIVPLSRRSSFEKYCDFLEIVTYDENVSLAESLQRLASAAKVRPLELGQTEIAPRPEIPSDVIRTPNSARFDRRDPLLLAIVAGKGGVGKTLLATAAAAQFAESVETLLIDLDFFNRGLGSLAKWGEDAQTSLDNPVPVGLLGGAAVGVKYKDSWRAFRVTERLRVLSPRLEPAEERALQLLPLPAIRGHLGAWLREVAEQTKAKVIILDTHGSADSLSIAATMLARHTIMVVEDEPVAAEGTLNFVKLLREWSDGERRRLPIIYNRVPLGRTRRDINRQAAQLRRTDIESQKKDPPARSGKTNGNFAVSWLGPVIGVFPREDYMARAARRHPLTTRDYPDSVLASRTRVWTFPLSTTLTPSQTRAERPSWFARYLARRTVGHPPFFTRLEFALGLLAVVAAMSVVFNLASNLYESRLWIAEDSFERLVTIVAAVEEQGQSTYWRDRIHVWDDQVADYPEAVRKAKTKSGEAGREFFDPSELDTQRFEKAFQRVTDLVGQVERDTREADEQLPEKHTVIRLQTNAAMVNAGRRWFRSVLQKQYPLRLTGFSDQTDWKDDDIQKNLQRIQRAFDRFLPWNDAIFDHPYGYGDIPKLPLTLLALVGGLIYFGYWRGACLRLLQQAAARPPWKAGFYGACGLTMTLSCILAVGIWWDSVDPKGVRYLAGLDWQRWRLNYKWYELPPLFIVLGSLTLLLIYDLHRLRPRFAFPASRQRGARALVALAYAMVFGFAFFYVWSEWAS